MDRLSKYKVDSSFFLDEQTEPKPEKDKAPEVDDSQISDSSEKLDHLQKKIYIKGDDEQSTNFDDTYEYSDDEDIIIVKCKNGSFKLNRRALNDQFREIKEYAGYLTEDLNKSASETFRHIVKTITPIRDSQVYYDLIMNDVREIFNDVKELKPGTVASFFIGCYNNDNFPGPLGCNPKCANSLRPGSDYPVFSECSDLVLIYNSDGYFSSFNDATSEYVYIYIGDPNFKGFSDHNIKQLKSAGIKKGSIIYGNEDGTYKQITPATDVDNLPKLNDPQNTNLTSKGTSKGTETKESTTTTSSTYAMVWLLLVVLAIILLVLAVLYATNK